MAHSLSVMWILLWANLFGAAPGDFAQDARVPFSLRIRTPKTVTEAGARARFSVLLTNTSDHVVSMCIDQGGNVLVSDDHAAWQLSGMKPAASDRNGFVRGEGCGPIQPGETKETWFDLLEAYNLDQPGKYTLWVSRVDPAGNVPRADTIAVTVAGPAR